jgi:hypothetical protein
MFSTFPNRATELSRGRALAPFVHETQRTVKYATQRTAKYANLLLQMKK